MSKLIKPTVGRIVLLMFGAGNWPGFVKPDHGQPCAAIVTRVWGDRCINVCAFDANGMPQGFTSVRLLQEDDTAREDEMHAKWMDYQKGQAAKTEQLEDKLAAAPVAPQPPVDNAHVAPGCEQFGCAQASSTPLDRVILERKELDAKLEKLGVFIGTKPFFALSVESRDLLLAQHRVMADYSLILGQRIELMQVPA